MAQDTKPGWSRVFVRPTATERPHGPPTVGATSQGAPGGPTLQQTIDEFLVAVDEGAARDRYGRPFARGATRDLHWYLGAHVLEALGAVRLDEVRRRDLEALVDELGDSGMPRARLRALAKCVRALYDYAIERRLVRSNPAERIAIPDDDEPQRPSMRPARPVHPALDQSIPDHVISLALRVATLGFLLTALVFLAESL